MKIVQPTRKPSQKNPARIENEHKITTFETARKLVTQDLKLALEILRNVM